MFGIGGQELVLLMLIGLIVLGPERLPRIANQIGNWLGQARRMTRVMKRQLEEELDINKPPTIKPAARQPSFKSTEDNTYKTPEQSDEDNLSSAHGIDNPGTGEEDNESHNGEDVAAAEAERKAVEEATVAESDDDRAPKNELS